MLLPNAKCECVMPSVQWVPLLLIRTCSGFLLRPALNCTGKQASHSRVGRYGTQLFQSGWGSPRLSSHHGVVLHRREVAGAGTLGGDPSSRCSYIGGRLHSWMPDALLSPEHQLGSDRYVCCTRPPRSASRCRGERRDISARSFRSACSRCQAAKWSRSALVGDWAADAAVSGGSAHL